MRATGLDAGAIEVWRIDRNPRLRLGQASPGTRSAGRSRTEIALPQTGTMAGRKRRSIVVVVDILFIDFIEYPTDNDCTGNQQ